MVFEIIDNRWFMVTSNRFSPQLLLSVLFEQEATYKYGYRLIATELKKKVT